MERQKREHRLGLWIQRQISDMKMANNLLPVIEKLARQKQKTNCGQRGNGGEKGKWGKGGRGERNRHRNDNCKNSFK